MVSPEFVNRSRGLANFSSGCKGELTVLCGFLDTVYSCSVGVTYHTAGSLSPQYASTPFLGSNIFSPGPLAGQVTPFSFRLESRASFVFLLCNSLPCFPVMGTIGTTGTKVCGNSTHGRYGGHPRSLTDPDSLGAVRFFELICTSLMLTVSELVLTLVLLSVTGKLESGSEVARSFFLWVNFACIDGVLVQKEACYPSGLLWQRRPTLV